MKIGETMYKAEQAAAAAQAGAAQSGAGKPHDDNVVDAEFEEIHDKKKPS